MPAMNKQHKTNVTGETLQKTQNIMIQKEHGSTNQVCKQPAKTQILKSAIQFIVIYIFSFDCNLQIFEMTKKNWSIYQQEKVHFSNIIKLTIKC